MNTLVGQLPRHLYVFVDSSFTHREPRGFVPAVWFGLVSFPGRVWGCTVLLDSGAVYRNLPPHALAFSAEPELNWFVEDAQTWDCYGRGFSCIEYSYLANIIRCKARLKNGRLVDGDYLFTAAPMGDGFSAYPEQAKEFSFVRLDNDRLTIQPTNNLIFEDRSFTVNPGMEFPKGLKRQTETYTCED
jgi:hypothetical protein